MFPACFHRLAGFFAPMATPALCGAVLSCTTSSPDNIICESMAWLDTKPRKAEYPPRPADGITHWHTGLPAATQDNLPHPSHAESKVASHRNDQSGGDQTAAPAGAPARHWQYLPSSYPVLYRTEGRRRHRSRCHSPGNCPRKPRQTYHRCVEKVGPAIVPRANVPLVHRSAGTRASREGHGSPCR
jgi:hypothetical protein